MSAYGNTRRAVVDDLPLFKPPAPDTRSGDRSKAGAVQAGKITQTCAVGSQSDRAASTLAGEIRKQRGIQRATATSPTFVATMRAEAERIARETGSVHIDDVRLRAGEIGIAPASSAAWGAIFAERGKWRVIGHRASAVVSNHGHVSPVRVLA